MSDTIFDNDRSCREFMDHLAARSVAIDAELLTLVGSIVDDVRVRGDRALIDYAARFDDVDLKTSELRISEDQLQSFC